MPGQRESFGGRIYAGHSFVALTQVKLRGSDGGVQIHVSIPLPPSFSLSPHPFRVRSRHDRTRTLPKQFPQFFLAYLTAVSATSLLILINHFCVWQTRPT